MTMLMKNLVYIVILLLAVPAVLADIDNFFSVKETVNPYEVVPGESFVVQFTISNRDLVRPKNVTAYLDPCPVGWKCGRETFSFADTGLHAVNLSVDVPKTALPKRYTMYILLDSDSMFRRGEDRVRITVLSEEQKNTLTYEEYLAKQEEDDKPVPVKELPELEPGDEPYSEPEVKDLPEPELYAESEPVDAPIEELPEENKSEIIENVERLESSHQFVEYASVVLIVLLVFIAAGAFMSFRKEK